MQKYDVIYVRQSVDRADSISIESQIEYCRYETRGGPYKVFQDKGYSGKNTDRPQFQMMMETIRRNEVSRVIVYKLDRISRSILDFATMMAEFQKIGVEFVSCTEKFDTSTPMGRAMLNICIVFAQLERETIQMRVEDAYVSRSRRGFYMGGSIPYGYRLEPYMVDGKRTSRYIIKPDEAEIVKLIFSMYAEPQTSYGDIVKYMVRNGIKNSRTQNGEWDRCRISDMIKNPIYVKADLDVYHFYKEHGSVLHNNPEDYVGTNGCYLYSDRRAGRKSIHLEGQHVVLAPHMGIIPSDIWLKARMKCLNGQCVAKPLKARNTWLAGKIKCGKCGYAMSVKRSGTSTVRYMMCSHRMKTQACEGVRGISADALEKAVLSEMIDRLREFDTLSRRQPQSPSPEIHELNIKIEQTSAEIEKFLNKVVEADSVLMDYIGKRVNELDEQVNGYRQRLNELSLSQNSADCNLGELKNYMQHWDELSFDDKRTVVDQLIATVKVSEEDLEIIWKI